MTARSPVEFTDLNNRRVGNRVDVANIVDSITTSLPVRFGDSSSVDAFSRLRISEPVSRFDAQFTYGLQPLIYEQLTNGAGAAIAHDTTERAAVLTLSNTPAGGYAYMQSYKWLYYHPGNSQLIFITFNFRGHATNTTKFVGYSDLTNNGVQFISSGGAVAWRLLSNTSEGDTTITQDKWNLDKLDGTGLSGITLDITKTQIAVIDLQALYTGRVRVGFDIGGSIIYCHEFDHANISAYPYIQTATLPVIAGMTCSDTASTTMLFICSTVRSEGATLVEEGFGFSIEGTATAGNSARAHILSLRPKTTLSALANRVTFILESVEVFVSGNTAVLWELAIGQAISGTTTFNDVNATYSAFEYNTAGTISGGPVIVFAQGYCAASAVTKTAISRDIANRYPITLGAAGAVRALGTLSGLVTGLGATSASRMSLNWREIR